ncbi:STAS domain-containing protein [Streptomyces sp. NPDC001553]|uniref:STAS domain-containing protein n=1 Tax=Streptomyces sp. NPDC001553 TaxID=3154385 RepID=UPI0033221A5C
MVLAGRYGLLRLAGELDLETGSAIRDAVRNCLDNRPALLRIDISGVSFCDCSGIAALLWAKAEAGRAGTGFHLSGGPPGPSSPASWTPPAQQPTSACCHDPPSKAAAGEGSARHEPRHPPPVPDRNGPGVGPGGQPQVRISAITGFPNRATAAAAPA